jgi:hypothetical protein
LATEASEHPGVLVECLSELGDVPLACAVDTGLKIYPDEVIVQGPPWNTTLCVRGTDHLDTEAGRVYENRYVIWSRMAWGLLREYEVYEDTQAPRRSMSTSHVATSPRSPRPNARSAGT